MILFRVLLLLLFLWLLFKIYKQFKSSSNKKIERQQNSLPDRMQRCSHCGVFIPQGEALSDGDNFFCSEQHKTEYTDSE